jgi:hypothetical protein
VDIITRELGVKTINSRTYMQLLSA